MRTRKGWLILAAVGILASCGNDTGERVAGTALMGGAMGIPAGPIGIVAGAGVGAVAGAVIPASVIDGRPRDTDSR